MFYKESITNIILSRKIDELYVSISLRQFAMALVGVFIPIHLLLLGYPLKSMIWLYIAMQTAKLITTYPAARLVAKFGLRQMVMLSTTILTLFFIMFGTIEEMHWPLAAIGIVGGIQEGIFWTSYKINLAINSNKKPRRKKTKQLETILSLIKSAAPAIGGIVIGMTNILALIIVVTIILIISIFPLLLSKETHKQFKLSLKDIKHNKTRKELLNYIARGVEAAAMSLLWPVFIYFAIINDYTQMGLVITITSVIALIVAIISTKITGKHRQTSQKIGGILSAAIWIWKAFIATTMGVYITTALHGATEEITRIPSKGKSYKEESKNNLVQGALIRQLGLNTGFILLLIAMLYIKNITTSFVIAAGASVVYLLL